MGFLDVVLVAGLMSAASLRIEKTLKDAPLKRHTWYTDSLQPIDASAPAPANRLLTRKNVCMQGNGFRPWQEGCSRARMCAGAIKQDEAESLANAFKLKDIPADYKGEVVKGAVLVATVQYEGYYLYDNIGHAGSSLFPIYDAFATLKDHHWGTLPVNVTGVLMHQADSDEAGFLRSDWQKRVSQIVAHNDRANDVKYFKRPDVQKGICAEQIIFFDRPLRTMDHGEFFANSAHAIAFQEHGIDTLGLPQELKATVRKPNRIVNMVIRHDTQGITNQNEINEKTRAYLTSRCWEMFEFTPGAIHGIKDQAEAFAKADISISVHGAHFQNMVWQAKKTAGIIIEKRKFHDEDVTRLGKSMGIFTYKVGPTSFPNEPKVNADWIPNILPGWKAKEQEVALWEVEDPKYINDPMALNFEKELKPVLAQAIDDLEKIAYRGPKCSNGA